MSVLHIAPDPRLRARELSSYIGMIICLGTFGMLFGGLFFAYAVLRVNAAEWPPEGVPKLPLALPALNTAVLLLSSATLSRGMSRLRHGRATEFPIWLAATIALGAAFVALQLRLWSSTAHDGIGLETTYGSVFFGLTCIHALHIVVGLVALLVLAVPAFSGKNLTARYGQVRMVSMFWHFVDAIWLVMFFSIFVF